MFEIDIDDAIGEFWGMGISPQFIKEKLKEANGRPVQFNINSPGGFVVDGLAIFNEIKNYSGEKTARIIGLAASMASIIPLACDKVVAENNAIYMIHNPLNCACGDYQAMQENADFLKRMALHLQTEYIGKTGKDQKQIGEWMDEETWFFGGEILEAGFIDELLPPKNVSDKNKKDNSASAASGAGNEPSNPCPDEERDKESNLINAHARFESMKKDLTQQTIELKDLQKAAAMLPDSVAKKEAVKDLTTEKETVKITENNVKEKKPMDLQTLRNDHSDLVANIEKAAIEKEQKRVSAHLKFIDAAPEAVIENIKTGKSFLDEDVQATYLESRMKKGIVDNAEEENPDNVDSEPEAAPEVEPEAKPEENDDADPMENDSDENVEAFLSGREISAAK